ncbi:DUF3040 domain-containing protein [Tessaracoccus flavus]|uniref:Uncharacterized protein n=1 Tax=Tessaracoccus flavus TaxID=1610493 RepID=A0A1Q2CD92_9ACTN|nr:DUF3040 domain-containing protein [Tessaracoccus flavus]AQP44074.1 hypothetical protein RPIT_03960 [Tessaracoccus flavus]SDY33967.1 Protein of unknown function [Tessaracoccus flavus]
MALSEQERKLLEQLEASLMADDPKLHDTLSGSSSIRVHRRRATLAGLGFIAGVVVLLVGVQIHPAISIAGFVLMLVGALVGINSWQRVGDDSDQPARPRFTAPSGGPAQTSQDFMDKLEERWRRRQQGDL